MLPSVRLFCDKVAHVAERSEWKTVDDLLDKYLCLSKVEHERMQSSATVARIVQLRKKYKHLNDDEFYSKYYDEVSSIFASSKQSSKCRGGKSFEDFVARLFSLNGIPFFREHVMIKNSKVVGDFIIPLSLTEVYIVSAKTSARERYTQVLKESQQAHVKHVAFLTVDRTNDLTSSKVNELKDNNVSLILPSFVTKRHSGALTVSKFISTMKSSVRKLTTLDLFCGAGGMTTGFEQAGYRSLAGYDAIECFIETFRTNGTKRKGFCRDLTVTSPADIEDDIGTSDIDVIIGGPPCQSFSMAGRRKPDDDRNLLFLEFCKCLEHFQPRMFVMENVPGILSKKDESGNLVVDEILKEFTRVGYEVTYKKLNAADYGVPQKRQRVFFVGILRTYKYTFQFPKPTHATKDHVPISTCLLDKEDVDDKYYHSQKMINGFKKRKEINREKGKGYGYQVADLDKPSYTISARYWKDGSECVIKYSDDEMRKLTPLEVARIQTFPDSYKFCGSNANVYTQIGNAVPCLLARCIAKAVHKCILNLSEREDEESDEDSDENSDEENEVDIRSLSVSELKNLCKERKVKGYSKLTKAQLIELLESKL